MSRDSMMDDVVDGLVGVCLSLFSLALVYATYKTMHDFTKPGAAVHKNTTHQTYTGTVTDKNICSYE